MSTMVYAGRDSGIVTHGVTGDSGAERRRPSRVHLRRHRTVTPIVRWRSAARARDSPGLHQFAFILRRDEGGSRL